MAPYRDLNHDLPMVMVSHAAYPRITGNSEPASLSPFWIQKMLRQKMGYKGLVLSDDLEMKAIMTRSIEVAALEFIEATGDIFLICHDAALNHRRLRSCAGRSGTLHRLPP